MLSLLGATFRERMVIQNLYDASEQGVLVDGSEAKTDEREFYKALVEYGETFLPRKLPNYLRVVPTRHKTLRQRCRFAAQLALKQENLIYCEGVCYLGEGIFHHAWCVNENRYVHDPVYDLTRVQHLDNTVYIGIPISTEILKQLLVQKRDYGIFLLGGGNHE